MTRFNGECGGDEDKEEEEDPLFFIPYLGSYHFDLRQSHVGLIEINLLFSCGKADNSARDKSFFFFFFFLMGVQKKAKTAQTNMIAYVA